MITCTSNFIALLSAYLEQREQEKALELRLRQLRNQQQQPPQSVRRPPLPQKPSSTDKTGLDDDLLRRLDALRPKSSAATAPNSSSNRGSRPMH